MFLLLLSILIIFCYIFFYLKQSKIVLYKKNYFIAKGNIFVKFSFSISKQMIKTRKRKIKQNENKERILLITKSQKYTSQIRIRADALYLFYSDITDKKKLILISGTVIVDNVRSYTDTGILCNAYGVK